MGSVFLEWILILDSEILTIHSFSTYVRAAGC